MSRRKSRKSNGQYAKRRSPLTITGSWLASFASIGCVYLTSRMLMADLAAFRSCNSNNNGLQIVSCGKRSLNMGDLLLFVLVALSVALVVALFWHSWRITRRIAL